MSWPDLRPPADRRPFWSRLAWLTAIWGLSVLALGAVALVLRWWIRA